MLAANDTHTDAAAKRRPRSNWYRATRHTFASHRASHWVMDGGPSDKLKEILGHSTVHVTERDAHLKADLFPAGDLAAVTVDLVPGTTEAGTVGYAVATQEVNKRAATS